MLGPLGKTLSMFVTTCKHSGNYGKCKGKILSNFVLNGNSSVSKDTQINDSVEVRGCLSRPSVERTLYLNLAP